MNITLFLLNGFIRLHQASYGRGNVFGNRKGVLKGYFLPASKSQIIALLNEVYEICLKDTVLNWIFMQDKLLFESFQSLGRVNVEIDVELYLLTGREQLLHVFSHYWKLDFKVRFMDVETVQFDLLEMA